jgi:hypothetical protein
LAHVACLGRSFRSFNNTAATAEPEEERTEHELLLQDSILPDPSCPPEYHALWAEALGWASLGELRRALGEALGEGAVGWVEVRTGDWASPLHGRWLAERLEAWAAGRGLQGVVWVEREGGEKALHHWTPGLNSVREVSRVRG